MRFLRLILVGASAVSLAGACAAPQRPRPPPRGEDEGGIYLYVQPFPGHAAGLGLSVESVAAVRADGVEVPLRVRLQELSGGTVTRQRLVAAAGAPGGSYAGVRLRLSSARITANGDHDVALPVPEDGLVLPASFPVGPGRAVVLWLSLRPEPPAAGAPLAAMLALDRAHEAIPERAGLSANAGSRDVTIFDVLQRQVAGVLLLDAAPGGAALDPVSRRLFVSLPERDELRSFDLATGERRDVLRLQPGDAPGPVALAPGGRLLLAVNPGSRTVSFVDPATLVELGRAPVGELPVSVLVDRAGSRAYVFNRRSASITVLDLANRAVAGTVPTDPEPLLGALDRAGTRLAVVSAGSMYVSVLAVPGLAPAARFFVGLGATAVQFDPRTDLLYVAKGDERRLDLFSALSPLPIGRIDVPGAVSRLLVEELDGTLFALLPEGSVAVVDLAARRVAAVLDVGDEPVDLTLAGERR